MMKLSYSRMRHDLEFYRQGKRPPAAMSGRPSATPGQRSKSGRKGKKKDKLNASVSISGFGSEMNLLEGSP